MGFGGSAGAMNTIIKNNRKLLNKRKPFKKAQLYYRFSDKQEFNFPKASTNTLRDLRTRIKEEEKNKNKLLLSIFCFRMIVVLVTAIYILNNLNF